MSCIDIFLHAPENDKTLKGSAMGLLQDIQRKIKAKDAEVIELKEKMRAIELQIESAKSYILGLQEILPRVAREENVSPANNGATMEFRKGSAPDLVKGVLVQEGSALHVDEILVRLGKSGDKKAKLALVGTLSRYAREGMVFKKTAPNTFALISDAGGTGEQEPPEGFGSD